MTKETQPLKWEDLPDHIRQALDAVPAITAQDEAELAAAVKAVQDDPEFDAEYWQSVVIENILTALEERGESKSALAAKMGQSRQSISKLLNEEETHNFTLLTVCKLANAVGRKLHLSMPRIGECCTVINFASPNVMRVAGAPESARIEQGPRILPKPKMFRDMREFEPSRLMPPNMKGAIDKMAA